MTLAAPSAPFERVVLNNVSWSLYEKMLSEVHDGGVRLTFHHGRLEIMTLSAEHEDAKALIGQLITIFAFSHDVDVQGYGSTTFRSESLECGLEPDDCYYITHAAYIAERGALDPQTDPPPDLAIEIDISRSSVPKQPIYAALGIPEVWRFDGQQLTYLCLEDGVYAAIAKSLAFPDLPLDRMNEFLAIGLGGKQSSALRAMRKWIAGEHH